MECHVSRRQLNSLVIDRSFSVKGLITNQAKMNKGKKLVFETIKNDGKRKNECDGNSRKFTTGFSRKADF